MSVRAWLGLGLGLLVAAVAAVLVWQAMGDGGDADPVASGDAVGVEVEVAGAGGDGGGGEPATGCLLLADDDDERRQGLMEVTDLGGFDGMVFAFDEAEPRGFWMRNTPMPLSIAFYDDAGGFVSSHDMSPCDDRDDCPSTVSGGPAMYAVEVPQGELPALGLVPGSRLTVTDRTCRP